MFQILFNKYAFKKFHKFHLYFLCIPIIPIQNFASTVIHVIGALESC